MSAAPQKFPYTYTAGDQLPAIQGRLDNTDITGWTIHLNLKRPDASVVTLTATLDDPTNGLFHFDWGPTDLVEGSNQNCEVRMADASGKRQTGAPFAIDVRAANAT